MSGPSTLREVSPELKATPSPAWYRVALRKTLWFIQDQWFLIGIGILILIASQVRHHHHHHHRFSFKTHLDTSFSHSAFQAQVPLSQQKLKEDVVNYLCPAIIFLITGCTLPTRVLIANARRFTLHLYVQVGSFLVCSATVFGIVSIIATNATYMDPALMVGMIFMASAPTTISSNVVMTRSAHGNDALTVVESALGNVLAPFITPLLIRMYLASGAWYTHVVPSSSSAFGPLYARVFKKLGLNMLVPLFVGQLIQYFIPKPTKIVMTQYKVSKLSSVALLVIIWSTYDKAFATQAFNTVAGSNIILVVFSSIGFYALWLALSLFVSRLWLNKRDTIAVAYCIPAKTPAMGVPLASAMFIGIAPDTSAKLQIPLVIFQGLQIAAGSLATIPFRRWVRDEEEAEKRRKDELAAVNEKAPVSDEKALPW